MTEVHKHYVNSSGTFLGTFAFPDEGAATTGKPVGAVEVSAPPTDARQLWNDVDEVWLPLEPAVEDVIAERNRRLALGFQYDFGDARGIHQIATTDADMKGWDEVTMGAQAAINLGQPSASFGILTETGSATVSALEWQSILAAATTFRQPIWAASFTLTAMNPIPADYADNSYWP